MLSIRTMVKKIPTLLLATLFALLLPGLTATTTTAKADGVDKSAYLIAPPAMKVFPMWEARRCQKDTYACYDFNKTKELLNVDLNIQESLRKLDIMMKNVTDLTNANKSLKEIIAIFEKELGEEKDRLAEKQAVLKTTTLKLKKANAGSFTTALPWVITVGAFCVVGAFFGGVYVGRT